MKFYFSVMLFVLGVTYSFAQVTSDYAVQVSATVETNPAAVNLQWPSISFSQGYTIYRKLESDNTWGRAIATLPGSALAWTDTSVRLGGKYEYRIRCDNQISLGNTFEAYGYILVGIQTPVTEYRGKIILLIDDSFSNNLAPEINRLVTDMRGDGWVVIKHIVKRTDSVPAIKQLIKDDYNADKTNTKALFLLGHIPVPYSGDYAPDGHLNHFGAWPADSYYGDMTGTWTDTFLVDTAGSYVRNWNKIGDGKFDQEFVTSLQLEVGRVDFVDMPAFNESETAIMKRYLNKDHDFRIKKLVPAERAFIDDKFGVFGGEAFAASGYKAFAPMFGDKKITTGNYLDSCKTNSYLCSYACSGGQPDGFISYFTTDSFVKDSLPTVFTMFFGSWFGDWEFTNDFLRAPLASRGWQLTNCWSGRPHWIMHQMALGENIGYCARLSGVEVNLYLRNNLSRMGVPSLNSYVDGKYQGALRNNALMGDPTLRMHVVAPPAGASLFNSSDSAKAKSTISIVWGSSPQNDVLGYNIYRSGSLDSPFVRINNTLIPVPDTNYTDTLSKHGLNYYMVRAVALQKSGSGTYYNMSEGQFAGSTYSFTSAPAIKNAETIQFELYPNPSRGNFVIRLNENIQSRNEITITDVLGKTVYYDAGNTSRNIQVNIPELNKGVYFVTLKNENGMGVKKIIIE